MSFVNKQERVFCSHHSIPTARSEARLKRYQSASDRRAWCNEAELRRQYFMEKSASNKGQICLDNLIPLDLLYSSIIPNKEDELMQLRFRLAYLEYQVAKYRGVQLTPEQEKQVKDLKMKYHIED